MHLKWSSAKWRPFNLGLDVLSGKSRCRRRESGQGGHFKNPYQGRIQDLKLGVAQMDWIEKFKKLGVGV